MYDAIKNSWMLFFNEVNHGVFNVLCGLNLNSSSLVMNETKSAGDEIFKQLSFIPWTINYSTVLVPSLVDFARPVLAPP